MNTLLLADDDREFAALLSEYLESQGFKVCQVHDGAQALQQCSQQDFSALILDVMMPEKDGFEVLRELRANASLNDLPVLMLTARGDDIDRIVGLEMGADDYLPKPCNPRELAARLRAILRRRVTDISALPTERLALGDLLLDTRIREAILADEQLNLTSAEFDVLKVLLEQAGTVVSKEELSQQALDRPLGAYDRSIDVHISHLRRKLGNHNDGRPRIRTVRNRGYQYAPPTTQAAAPA